MWIRHWSTFLPMWTGPSRRRTDRALQSGTATDGLCRKRGVKGFLERSGQEALPLILVDGEVALAGRYPNRAELARWAGIELLRRRGKAGQELLLRSAVLLTKEGVTMKFLEQPPRFLFFTGKGGVGKTSIACATAIQLAEQGNACCWSAPIRPPMSARCSASTSAIDHGIEACRACPRSKSIRRPPPKLIATASSVRCAACCRTPW